MRCIAVTFPAEISLITCGIADSAVPASFALLVVQIEVIERGTFDPGLIK
jgi:hypothetical protein